MPDFDKRQAFEEAEQAIRAVSAIKAVKDSLDMAELYSPGSLVNALHDCEVVHVHDKRILQNQFTRMLSLTGLTEAKDGLINQIGSVAQAPVYGWYGKTWVAVLYQVWVTDQKMTNMLEKVVVDEQG
jgi:hypothetical protein